MEPQGSALLGLVGEHLADGALMAPEPCKTSLLLALGAGPTLAGVQVLERDWMAEQTLEAGQALEQGLGLEMGQVLGPETARGPEMAQEKEPDLALQSALG